LPEHFELSRGQQRERAESAAVPEHQFVGLMERRVRLQSPDDSAVIERRGFSDKQQSGHAGFNDQDVAGIEYQERAFAESGDALKRASGKLFDGTAVGRDADGPACAGGERD
jgi:hypothetical protein